MLIIHIFNIIIIYKYIIMSSYYEKNKIKLREYHRKRYYEQKEKNKNIKNEEKKEKIKDNIEEPKFKIEYKKVIVEIP